MRAWEWVHVPAEEAQRLKHEEEKNDRASKRAVQKIKSMQPNAWGSPACVDMADCGTPPDHPDSVAPQPAAPPAAPPVYPMHFAHRSYEHDDGGIDDEALLALGAS